MHWRLAPGQVQAGFDFVLPADQFGQAASVLERGAHLRLGIGEALAGVGNGAGEAVGEVFEVLNRVFNRADGAQGGVG